MSRSFFTAASPTALYNGSNNFSTRISASPTDYGLTADDASAYSVLNSAYATAYTLAIEPATRTKPTITGRNEAAVPLREMAARLAKIIDGHAEVSDQQKLDLGLNVRKTPGPIAAPGTPRELKVSFAGNGALILKWKCANPRGSTGVLYQIWRQIDGGELTYLGGAGEKQFIDATLPAGSKQVSYQMQAVRSTAVGMWATFDVKFGVEKNATNQKEVATVTESTEGLRIAA
jgi:hypothetical protein